MDGGLEIDAVRSWARVVSDCRVRCPNGDLAGAMRGGWQDVTVYHEILNQGPGPGECILGGWGWLLPACPRYAVHTWDMFLLWGEKHWAFDGIPFMHTWTDEDKHMSERLQDYIWEFGASGRVGNWEDGGRFNRWPTEGYEVALSPRCPSGWIAGGNWYGCGAAIVLEPGSEVTARGVVGQSACAWHAANFGIWNQSLIN